MMNSHYTPVWWCATACCCQDNYQHHATLLVYLNDVEHGGVTRPPSSPGSMSLNCLGLKRPHDMMLRAFSVGPRSLILLLDLGFCAQVSWPGSRNQATMWPRAGGPQRPVLLSHVVEESYWIQNRIRRPTRCCRIAYGYLPRNVFARCLLLHTAPDITHHHPHSWYTRDSSALSNLTAEAIVFSGLQRWLGARGAASKHLGRDSQQIPTRPGPNLLAFWC